jgi:SPP1 gp7 family putative phage head morphogenesis protein
MANYWEERFKRLKTAEMRKAERANADLARVYRETLRQLRAEVEQWYDRFAKENKISLAEARRILDNRELKEFKMTLTDFIKEAKRLDLDPAHIRMLENASMRVRLTRSQEIYLKTAQYVEKLAKTQGLELSGLMRDVYTDSVYKTAYETQKVTGFENFRAVRERQIEEAISKPWASDGADFSSRIWKNKTQLINSLQTDITQSLMTGTSTAQLSEKIAMRFNTSYNQAYRLVETETAYIQERAMLDTYDELGLEQYQICAVLDSKTSEICQNLDGKVFDRKDAKPGITMPPFHCHCRSTTVPYIAGLLDDGGRVARDPETGKTVEIPDMTYKEWKERYVKPEAEKDPLADLIKWAKQIDIKTATKNEIIELGAAVNKHFNIIDHIGEKEYIRDAIGHFREMGGQVAPEQWAKGSSKKNKEMLNNAFSYYPKEWVNFLTASGRKLYTLKVRRGFFTPGAAMANGQRYQTRFANYRDGFVSIHMSGARKTTPFHEIGHYVEFFNPKVLQITKAFIADRTKGEKPTLLRELFQDTRYDKTEVTLKDDFITPYIGKMYDNASEVLSVGLESIFEPGEGHLKRVVREKSGRRESVYAKIQEDREYLDLIIGILIKG